VTGVVVVVVAAAAADDDDDVEEIADVVSTDESIADDIITGLESAHVVLVCMSQKYYESPYCKKGGRKQHLLIEAILASSTADISARANF